LCIGVKAHIGLEERKENTTTMQRHHANPSLLDDRFGGEVIIEEKEVGLPSLPALNSKSHGKGISISPPLTDPRNLS
jgi:hypothetical protein